LSAPDAAKVSGSKDESTTVHVEADRRGVGVGNAVRAEHVGADPRHLAPLTGDRQTVVGETLRDGPVPLLDQREPSSEVVQPLGRLADLLAGARGGGGRPR
jgi:hypothetical protein